MRILEKLEMYVIGGQTTAENPAMARFFNIKYVQGDKMEGIDPEQAAEIVKRYNAYKISAPQLL